MSRKRLKDMLRKEMDQRIKTYDTPKITEKPSLKFDLKTDLLGEPAELKSILKEQPPKQEETVEDTPLKKYLDEDDETSESDYSESDYSEEEDTDDYYIKKRPYNKKIEKSEDSKVKKDVERKKENERKDERKRDDERKDENERKTERKLEEYDDRYSKRRDDERRREDERRRKLI